MRLHKLSHIVFITVTLLSAIAFLGVSAAPAYAEPESDSTENKVELDVDTDSAGEGFTLGEIGGYLAGETSSTHVVYLQRRFTDPQGHAFAAEEANNFIDQLRGFDVEVVGYDNAANGPDRKIVNRDGSVTWIQDKYYQSASESVSAAFEGGEYRYVKDGKPMQLEVPADQYDDAVRLMRKRIEKGQVPGVSDPTEAESLVRKGNLTYQQAVNLTKAGNLTSLRYDAANGIVMAAPVAGITFVLDYLVCANNGMSAKEAAEESAKSAMLSGSAVFAGHMLSSQLMRTKLKSAMAPTAESVAKWLGDDVCREIIKEAGIETAGLTSKQLAERAGKMLSSKAVFNVGIVVVMSIPDAVDLYQGRMSQGQFVKNLAVIVIGMAGTEFGAIAGGIVGNHFVPGVGAKAGEILGAIAGGALGATVADLIGDKVFKDDADAMYAIVSDKFSKYCFEYVTSEKEAEALATELNGKLSENGLKNMFAAEDRDAFADNLIRPMFEKVARERAFKNFPETEYEVRTAMLSGLDGVVFIH